MSKGFIILGVWYIAISIWLIWITAFREGMSLNGSLFMGVAVLCGLIAGLSLHDWIKGSVSKLLTKNKRLNKNGKPPLLTNDTF